MNIPMHGVSLLALLGLSFAAGAQQSPAPQSGFIQLSAEQQQALQKRWDDADTNHDGYIDRDEAKAMHAIANNFDTLDADKDGKLSMSEFQNSAQNRLIAADTNHDGYIDRAEAQAHLPRLAKAFDRVDTNKDGKLSPEELQALSTRLSRRFGP